MRFLCWNCQGLGNPWTIRCFQKLLKDQAPTVCFLMETRLNKTGFEKHYREVKFPNKLIVKKHDSGGGLALLWKRDVSMDVINFTENHILAKVVEEDGFVWYLTCFYGWPDSSQKAKSWALLSHLSSFMDGSWLCIGDFNVILHSDEKLSHKPPSYKQMDEFREVLEQCSLTDLGFLGYPFTWNNKRPGHANTKERLDRAVATMDWRTKFPRSTVTHLSSHASDHLPIILQTKTSKFRLARSNMGFKFEESWLLWEECEAVVHEGWNKMGGTGSVIANVKERIEGCGRELHAWGASKTHPNIERIKVLQKRIEVLNMSECTEGNKAEFSMVSKELDDLLLKQEIFWVQHSRISWLKHGDKNTKFFHAKASKRRRRNFIQGIKNHDDIWVEDEEEIAGVATRYFENIFKAGDCDRLEECLVAVHPKVSPDMRDLLSSEYNPEEIKAALFQMGPTKAPGPDGMNALFYQKFWHIVGDDVINAVLDFLNNGIMVPDLNYTHIVLIPKIKSSEKITDYRPISLCNVIYKIISKVLANRLKLILPNLIATTQSVFVPGRLITDNFLVAYESLHAMHCRKKGRRGSLALKLDVYDRVKWAFLKGFMTKLGFPEMWIERVMCCVSTPSFSIRINGKSYGNIILSRGLRQGDLLSPYLFLLCAEGFSSLLAKVEAENKLHGVSICRRAPSISHLLFANDSFLFCRATQDEVQEIADILQLYATASGQQINL